MLKRSSFVKFMQINQYIGLTENSDITKGFISKMNRRETLPFIRYKLNRLPVVIESFTPLLTDWNS